MNKTLFELTDQLAANGTLTEEEFEFLVSNRTPEAAEQLEELAVEKRKAIYGNSVFIRGLIEISNICKNDCLYCGIRKSNRTVCRYRLSADDIFDCCQEGHELGFRTFVLQGGEDGFYTDSFLCALLDRIKTAFPDCAVTLSLGERSRESYRTLRAHGADRYLLRHETATKDHYALLHPSSMSFEKRMECLYALKDLGYQVGCGFMVGSPYQTAAHIARDLKFIEEFRPDMCGIGPFIPQSDTPFGTEPAGSIELTCFLLSVIRLIHPSVLLPATTALGSLDPNGREKGILAGANVVMPNLSPASARKNYKLYDNKLSDGAENAGALSELRSRVSSIGYEIVSDRGDIIK
ncbi:MAG: [Oscillospiraceae bacterium]|nr:[FeFe] hydrogenase H-cluster radical SAM maturase HydE [Oscillospiraceae bacterium]